MHRLKSLIWGQYSAFGLWLALAVFVTDRANKYWLVDFWDLAAKGRVTLAPFFDLVLVWNRGVSYGLLTQESDLGRYLLFAFAIIISCVLIVWLAYSETKLWAFGLGLVIGGALSNAADRLIYGAVADFFSLHAFGFYWYVFNLADMAIVAGVAVLLYFSFSDSHKSAEKSD